MVVYGQDGLDEISMSARDWSARKPVREFKSLYDCAEDFRACPLQKEDLVGGLGENQKSRKVLNGKKGQSKAMRFFLNAARYFISEAGRIRWRKASKWPQNLSTAEKHLEIKWNLSGSHSYDLR